MSPAPTRKRVLDLVRVLVLVLVVVAVTLAVARNWHEVSGSLHRIGPGTLALSLALGMLSPFFTVLGWRALLADMGSSLHIAPASGVFFVGQLGKYLPGSVWSVLVQADMAVRLGVPRSRTAVVGLITIALSALCGMVAGLPALPSLLTRRDASFPPWVLVLLILVLVLAIAPPVLNRAVRLALRVLRRPPLEHDLSFAAIAQATWWFSLSWLTGGLVVWVMARTVADPGAGFWHVLVVSVSGYLLAAGIGMFSIIVPAGVGVRDVVLAGLLTTTMPTGAATAVVVVARFWSVLADVLWAATGWLWARRHHLLPSDTPDPQGEHRA